MNCEKCPLKDIVKFLLEKLQEKKEYIYIPYYPWYPVYPNWPTIVYQTDTYSTSTNTHSLSFTSASYS